MWLARPCSTPKGMPDSSARLLEHLHQENADLEEVARLLATGGADEQLRLVRPAVQAAVSLGLVKGPTLHLSKMVAELVSMSGGLGGRPFPPPYVKAVLHPPGAGGRPGHGRRWHRSMGGDDELEAVDPHDWPEAPQDAAAGSPESTPVQTAEEAPAKGLGDNLALRHRKSMEAWPKALGGPLVVAPDRRAPADLRQQEPALRRSILRSLQLPVWRLSP